MADNRFLACCLKQWVAVINLKQLRQCQNSLYEIRTGYSSASFECSKCK